GKYQNDFHRLPLPSLGDSNYAIVRVSVAHLREEPRHSAQLVDQNIMGNVIRLLKNRGGWYLVQTEYGYIGWMRRESFDRIDKKGIEKWNGMQKVRVTALFPIVYSHASEKSQPVTDVVLNSLLQYRGKQNGWTKVTTPDGRTGYIRGSMVTTNIAGNVAQEKLRWSIVKTAENMMGIPYLWGGNSRKGNDCSGFTQTVFRANGIRLLRDARQQAMEGKEIIPDKNFSNVLPGDLLFFGSGDRITHVGISLGGAEFIHQSGDVHINSLDPRAANYSDYRRKSLKKITRIISEN
ncbi:MAG: NlpC/P60 family protein, partial [Calditrichia bacterium]